MSMKREEDSDIHLVIADPKLGGSMIVEFPSDACDGAALPAARLMMTQARVDLAAACGGEPGANGGDADRQRDDHRRRLLRPHPRSGGRRAERHRVPPGALLLKRELPADHRQASRLA